MMKILETKKHLKKTQEDRGLLVSPSKPKQQVLSGMFRELSPGFQWFRRALLIAPDEDEALTPRISTK